jgi:hypothetical protein
MVKRELHVLINGATTRNAVPKVVLQVRADFQSQERFSGKKLRMAIPSWV